MDRVHDLKINPETARILFGSAASFVGAVLGVLSDAKTHVMPWSTTLLDNDGWSFGCEQKDMGDGYGVVWVVQVSHRKDAGEERDVFDVVAMESESHAKSASTMMQATLDMVRGNDAFLAEFDREWHSAEGEGDSGGGSALD